jgi:hypothetical protein
MELRQHPLMAYRGVSTWPPVWVQGTGTGTKTIKGEVGVLTGVTVDPSKKCFLHIEHENERYVGALLFEDDMFCWLVGRILVNQLGREIKHIGGLDLSFTL